MDKKNTYIVGAIIAIAAVVLVFIMFRSPQVSDQEDRTVPATEETGVVIPTILTVKHSYKDGEHTIAGTINLPTPCHLLEHTVTILPDSSRATIAFTRSFAGGDCPGGEKPQNFVVHFSGRQDMEIRATVDGHDVPLSIIEATPGEDLEKTQIFIKG